MTPRYSPHIRRALRASIPPLLLLGWWFWAAARPHPGSALFVSPTQALQEAIDMSAGGGLWPALLASLIRTLSGLAIGGGLGLIAGLALGLSRWLRRLFDPTLQTLKCVSLFAWIPLVMAWFGLDETAKIFLIALAVFFPMFMNSLEGVAAVPREWVELARTFGYSRRQLVVRVVLPSALPSLFTGLYLSQIYAWLATLGAEYMLTSSTGIGVLLNDAREDLRIDRVLVCILVVGVVGYLMTFLTALLERGLLRWQPKAHAQSVAI